MEEITLNFINRSNDGGKSNVVIYQRNSAQNSREVALAWKVIKHCGVNDNHSFIFPKSLEVAISDYSGRTTFPIPAIDGRAYEIVEKNMGDVLQLSSGGSMNPSEIEICNKQRHALFSANCYRDEKILASKHKLDPGSTAFFNFLQTIFIGVAPELEEGDEIDFFIHTELETQLNLMKIATADIVMTGGGSEPFRFTLENIQ